MKKKKKDMARLSNRSCQCISYLVIPLRVISLNQSGWVARLIELRRANAAFPRARTAICQPCGLTTQRTGYGAVLVPQWTVLNDRL